jgi:hypothetical protein
LARLRGRPLAGSKVLRGVAIAVLLGAAAVAVGNFLMLGIAAIGLFFRPGIGRALGWVAPVAFLAALVMLGLVLADGIQVVPGLVLGLAAFGAQVVVGTLMTRSLVRDDRLRLALSQQNGITAVILALLLESVFPGTVAVVAPAIVVVGVLHLAANTLLDKVVERRVRAARDPGHEKPLSGLSLKSVTAGSLLSQGSEARPGMS